MPWAVSGQTSPAGLRTHTRRRRTARYAVGLLLDLVRVYEAQAARYTPAVKPGWLDSTDAGGRAVRAALLLLGFLLVRCVPARVVCTRGLQGLDVTAGGVFWAPAVYVAYFVGRMVGRRET